MAIAEGEALLLDSESVARIERVMQRLYTEVRMDGNAMRDAAQTLEAALRNGVVVSWDLAMVPEDEEGG